MIYSPRNEPSCKPAQADNPGGFWSDWLKGPVQMCMEQKGKATATCYPQAIGTYVPLSRGLH